MHKLRHRKFSKDYVKSAVFGIEDSLVSTTGLIAGVAVASSDKKFVIVAGLIAIAVEAVSMAAGEFISEETEVDLQQGKDKANPIKSGAIMFVAYFLSGLVPIIPIIIFPLPQSIYIAVLAALVGLFILGLIKGQITKRGLIRSGLTVLIVGGIATAIGIAVGVIFRI